jgi:AcrR family transcriptional regulator
MRATIETNGSRNLIIQKVAEILCEERATATSIESAVAKAGVDRDEVKATFGSMQGLILEMVSDLSKAMIEPLEDHVAERTVRDVLLEFGNRLADSYSVSHLIALYRVVLTEATRHSGIGREFFERGPGRLEICLAEYLECAGRRFVELQISNPRCVAENFLTLLGDHLELSDAMTATRTPSARDHREAVVEAVELLCRGLVAKGES